MLFRINEIGLFQDTKRDVIKFNKDINFISGESNTGKSSIGEIIDYCLASTKQTVPAGKIINEIDIFSIFLTLGNHNIIIARNRYDSEKFSGQKFIFFKQVQDDFSLSNIDIDFFTENELEYFTKNDFLELEISKYFPSFPPKTRLDGKEMVRPTIRNMPPFMFQVQDVIKNKRHLFYQMDRGNKVKGIKRDFELFLGLIDFDIYNKVNRKNEIIKELKKIENRHNLYEDEIKNEYINLRSNYHRLYTHLNRDIDVDSLEESTLLDYKNLDEIVLEYSVDSDVVKKVDELESLSNKQSRIVEQLKVQYSSIKNQIRHIDTANLQLSKFTSNSHYHKTCPICDSKTEKKFEVFDTAKKKILEEKDFLDHYNKDLLREKELEVKTKLDGEKSILISMMNQVSELKKDVVEIQSIEEKKKLLFELKGIIKQNIKQIQKYENNLLDNDKISKLEEELEKLDKKLKKVDLKKKRQEAEYLIGYYSTEMLKTLPFDNNDYGEPNLKFDVKDVEAYQQGNKDIFYLSDIGSAENHLSFHLSVFLGLHKYIIENDSAILPSFIFLDQPSQVYFPKEEDFKKGTGDIKKVEDMYKSIISFISSCNDKSLLSGIQIIITDHFYSEEEWYKKYLVEPRWEKNKNLGLIK